MGSTGSRKGKRGTFVRPRPLTRSEIDSLRRDAISTAEALRESIARRREGQGKSITKLMSAPRPRAAAE